MTVFNCILLGFLVICAVAASLSKKLLNTILIFMSYSLVMSVIWILLESPDLAITEAAVGAGVTTVLFLITLKKIGAVINEDDSSVETKDVELKDIEIKGIETKGSETKSSETESRVSHEL